MQDEFLQYLRDGASFYEQRDIYFTREELRRMKVTGLKYTLLLERNEEGGYTVTVPSLPGCITQGATWDEAIAHGREAIAGFLEALRDLGKPIPVEVAVEVAAEAVS